MEVAELLSAESRGVATDSGDLDVRAKLDVRVTRHIHTSEKIHTFQLKSLNPESYMSWI